MSVNIKFENLEEVLKTIEELSQAKGLENAMGKSCALVEASAKKKAPKDTGALRRSITSKVEKKTDEIEGVVYTPLEYAPYVEYGTGLFAEKGGRTSEWYYEDDEGVWHKTSGQHPHPYMRPALNDNRERILNNIKEGITKNG